MKLTMYVYTLLGGVASFTSTQVYSLQLYTKPRQTNSRNIGHVLGRWGHVARFKVLRDGAKTIEVDGTRRFDLAGMGASHICTVVSETLRLL